MMNRAMVVLTSLCVVGLLFAPTAAWAQTDSKNVEVVVNKALFDSGAITTNLDRYIDDLHRDGWNPTVTYFDYDYTSGAATQMTRAQDLRNHLKSRYQSPGGLAGTVFVGETPDMVMDYYK